MEAIWLQLRVGLHHQQWIFRSKILPQHLYLRQCKKKNQIIKKLNCSRDAAFLAIKTLWTCMIFFAAHKLDLNMNRSISFQQYWRKLLPPCGKSCYRCCNSYSWCHHPLVFFHLVLSYFWNACLFKAPVFQYSDSTDVCLHRSSPWRYAQQGICSSGRTVLNGFSLLEALLQKPSQHVALTNIHIYNLKT